MVGTLETPRDVKKRQEPHIGIMELLRCEGEINRIVNKEEKSVKEKAFKKAKSDYRAARLDLNQAKFKYKARVDAIRASIGLPEFLDSF